MEKNITSLRNHLFDALNRLAEATEVDIDLEVNKSIHIVNIAEAVIKTAHVENEFIALTKGVGSGFIPLIDNPRRLENNKDEYATINKSKMFDIDKESNWLINDGKSTSEGGLEVHHIGTNKND